MKTAVGFTIGKDVVCRKVNNEGILVDLSSGTYFGLNDVAMSIWEQFENGRALDEIASELSQEYDVEMSKASSDVQELFQKLQQANLISPE